MNFTVEAQDLITNKSYTDGCNVFTVAKVRAAGRDRLVVLTTTGRKFLANNTQGFDPR